MDTSLLVSSIDTLKQQHRRVLSLLQETHLASDERSFAYLDRAESIASSEYHDAYSYDLDDETAFSQDSGSASGDDHSTYHSDEDTDVDDAGSVHSARTVNGEETKNTQGNVKRRTQLPHPIAGDEVSLFGLLKKNMGKDLSKISMPISLNEPINQLQAMAEAIEYLDLLDTAAKSKDSMERLLYVTVFAISTYSNAKYRSSRKPFNPLLGETYELVRPDKGKSRLCHGLSRWF